MSSCACVSVCLFYLCVAGRTASGGLLILKDSFSNQSGGTKTDFFTENLDLYNGEEGGWRQNFAEKQ